MANTPLKKSGVSGSYRKAAKKLRQWLETNHKGWPRRSMDDDLAFAASLLDAAAVMADNLEKRRGR